MVLVPVSVAVSVLENTHGTLTGRYFGHKAQLRDFIGKTKQLCDGTEGPAAPLRFKVRWTQGLESFFPETMISVQSPL